MKHRKIGDLSVSLVGLGCNNFGGRLDAGGTAEVVHAALDVGVNFFDTADVYGGTRSEQLLGRALADRREAAVVATKFGAPNSAPEGVARGSVAWVTRACEASLRRLGTDYIDYYQIHFPDPDVPIEETLGAMDALVRAGKVREIGCSNFGSSRLYEAARVSAERELARFRTVQNRYSVLHRDPEPKVVPACRDLGMGLLPYFPLESGLLTGKYRTGEAPPAGTRLAAMPEAARTRFLGDAQLAQVERLREYAASHGHDLLTLAISWLASSPVVTSVIAGATTAEQVRSNAAAAGWEMSDQERADIDALVS
jgi:aryl-alcohol dehydrogenase-like predicted oxidoreductase